MTAAWKQRTGQTAGHPLVPQQEPSTPCFVQLGSTLQFTPKVPRVPQTLLVQANWDSWTSYVWGSVPWVSDYRQLASVKATPAPIAAARIAQLGEHEAEEAHS